jgi:hypothetical protein
MKCNWYWYFFSECKRNKKEKRPKQLLWENVD